ncbi:hypothetical protein ACFCXH_40325, partial [Streptomyces nojiriensis]|uniref:hypothetical protein n=1 Tax=Streptomyces nojiriensis TaxID=66374 RepID=UPI0035E2796C
MLHQYPHPGKPIVHHSAHALTPDRACLIPERLAFEAVRSVVTAMRPGALGSRRYAGRMAERHPPTATP